jgi:hypothetical protein
VSVLPRFPALRVHPRLQPGAIHNRVLGSGAGPWRSTFGVRRSTFNVWCAAFQHRSGISLFRRVRRDALLTCRQAVPACSIPKRAQAGRFAHFTTGGARPFLRLFLRAPDRRRP